MQVGYFTERPYRWLPEEEILGTSNPEQFGIIYRVDDIIKELGSAKGMD